MANDAKLPDGSVQISTRAKLPDGSVESKIFNTDNKIVKKINHNLLYVSIALLFIIEIGSNFLDTSTEKYQLYYYPLIVNIQLILGLINIVHYVCNRFLMKIIVGILIGVYIFQIISIISSIGLIGYEIGSNSIALGSLISLGFLAWMEAKL